MQGCNIQRDRGHKLKQVFKIFNLKCHLCIYLNDFFMFRLILPIFENHVNEFLSSISLHFNCDFKHL